MVRVEALTPDDWERSRDIRLAALADAPDAFWATHEAEVGFTERQWRERLEATDATTYVAVLDGRDAGCAVAAVHRDDPGLASLFAMWVAPWARRRGVGDALVEAVRLWARDLGLRAVRLDVVDDNAAAIALYRRHGAVETGARGAFPAPRDHLTEHELELPS